MEITVLLEPLEGGRFRAKAGDPFNLCAEGANTEEATRRLALLIDALLAQGRQITTLVVANGKALVPMPANMEEAARLLQAPWRPEPLPEDDEFFQEMRAAIAENRRLEDEAENRRWETDANR